MFPKQKEILQTKWSKKVVDLQIGKEENKLTMDILLDYEKNRPVAEKLVVGHKGRGVGMNQTSFAQLATV